MGTIIVGSVVAASLILAVRSMINAHRRGESVVCGGDCSHCGHCDPIKCAMQFEEFRKTRNTEKTV